MNDLSHIGFDEKLFRADANSILFEGTREILNNARDREKILEAYDRMDEKLVELVERMDPPQYMIVELKEKTRERLNLAGKIMRINGIDPAKHWEHDLKKVSLVILQNCTKDRIWRLDRLIADAIEVLAEKTNLNGQGAKRLIDGFAANECKTIADMIACVRDSPNGREFLGFLQREGNSKTQKLASAAIDRMLPSEKKRIAMVIAISQPRPLTPLGRHV